MSDIFTSGVLTFPPEDPQRLAETIRRDRDDSASRRIMAAAGLRFALQAAAESRSGFPPVRARTPPSLASSAPTQQLAEPCGQRRPGESFDLEQQIQR